jgi:hypothetical protein
MSVTDRTDPYEIIGVRRDASLAEIRISYRRSTQILAPERFASANDTVRAEAARRLAALNSAMESIEAERAAESGSALGSLSFGGPAVAPAAEPSMRSTAVVDEPPPLTTPTQEPEPQHEEARPPDVSDTVEEAPVADPEPTPEPEPAPVAAEPEPEPEVQAAPEPPAAAQGDTEDDLPPVGEDTSDIPIIVAEPAPAPAPTPQPVASTAPAPAPRRPERPTRKAPRKRSLMPRILAASAIVLGGAAIAAYFLLSGGSSKPSEGQFQGATAPVSFTYPSELVARQPPRGGLLKPTFSTAVGLNAANYVVVATYRISADVQSDGSAIGTGGSRLTADRFDESVDRAAERIASAQKLKATGPVQPGKAGDMIARIYTYTRPGGSSARYAFAFRGHTEYSIACFWDPAHAAQLSAACGRVMTSLQRV